MTEDHVAERLQEMRWALSDLDDLAQASELDPDLTSAIHAAAQDIYRGEEVLRRWGCAE
jgi:hypothetical protein